MDSGCHLWNPVDSAASHSQLAGLVAGLVFGGIILLLERRSRRSDEEKHEQAVALLIVGFMTFALDSFLFGVIAGEQTCSEAWSETMVAGGLLGVGSAGLFTSIAWLMHVHGAPDSLAFRVTRLSSYILAVVVASQLSLTAQLYLSAVFGVLPVWVLTLLSIYRAVAVLGVLAYVIAKKRYLRRPEAWAKWAAYTTVGYVFVAVVLFSWIAGLDASSAGQADVADRAKVATIISLTLPAVALGTQLLALPAPLRSGRTGDGPNGDTDKVPKPRGNRGKTKTSRTPRRDEQAVPDSAPALEPLDRSTLARRSIDIFPQGYLMNISIIQGVALSVLVAQAAEVLGRDGSSRPQMWVPVLSEAALSLTFLIVVSYEYLWFSTILRWVPTFRDTAIPVLLGVAEIIPSFLFGRHQKWWITTSAFLLLGSMAFANTITRLDRSMFPEGDQTYTALKNLLIKLTATSAASAVLAGALSVLVAKPTVDGGVLSSVGAILILVTSVVIAVSTTERTLNDVYKKYGIDRRPALFARIRANRIHRTPRTRNLWTSGLGREVYESDDE